MSGIFPVISFQCICYRTEDYHCVSVSHLFGLPLSQSISVYEWPCLSVTLTEDQALHRQPHIHINPKVMSNQLPNEYWGPSVKMVFSYGHSLKANMNKCSNSRKWMLSSRVKLQTHEIFLFIFIFIFIFILEVKWQSASEAAREMDGLTARMSQGCPGESNAVTFGGQCTYCWDVPGCL